MADKSSLNQDKKNVTSGDVKKQQKDVSQQNLNQSSQKIKPPQVPRRGMDDSQDVDR